MSGILEGLTVIEMGHFVAVPAAAVLLADWGADVIKIEPLDGDAQRGDISLVLKRTGSAVNWRFEVHNRSKKSIALDLKQAAGRDILYALVKDADVFMSNYQSETMETLKVDYPRLKQVNSRLVYASLTGYGRSGPERKERGFDFTAAWARTGIQHLLGEPGASPPMAPNGMMDRATGSLMVAGILGALFRREKTGEGQEIDLSLYHSGVWSLIADLQVTMGGTIVDPRDRTKALNPLCNTYQTRDGFWVQLAMLQADLAWPDFCKAVGAPELTADPRFAAMEARMDHCEELICILDATFASRDRADWDARLRENNCIFGWVEPPEAVINDPQAKANDFFTEMEHPEAGKARYLTTPVTFRQNPAVIRSIAPELGQHTEEILLELGLSWDDILELKEKGAII